MRSGGAGCSARLLLTVGWLLLAGLQSTCGINVTAIQDPSLAREGEGEPEGDEEPENDSDTESEPEAEAEDDSEGERHLLKAKPSLLFEEDENYPS